MVDLETLSTSMDAHILTIGAVAFNGVTGEIKDTFYRRIDFKSCEELCLHKSDDTLKFWETAPQKAREEAFGVENRVDIRDAIMSFVDFWNKNNGDEFWCNGANFDEPILSTIFEKLKIIKPWKFWKVRCLRTYLALKKSSMKMFGDVAHNALDDCKKQVEAYAYFNK